MIKCKGTTRSSYWQTMAHLKMASPRHKADKDYFGKRNDACLVAPFTDFFQSQVGYYDVMGSFLPTIDEQDFRKAIYARDPWGRTRQGVVAYHIVVSPSDRVQGFFHAVPDPKLCWELLGPAHWVMLRKVAAYMNGPFAASSHSDTTRFHTELLAAKYGPDGHRIRNNFSWDRAWLSGLASRKAAGFEETRYRMKEPRWNTTLAIELEQELLHLCQEFFQRHGLDQTKAADWTSRLQNEWRAGKGKAEARQRQAKPGVASPIEATASNTSPGAPERVHWESLTKELMSFRNEPTKRTQPSPSWQVATDGWPRLVERLLEALASEWAENEEASEFRAKYRLYISTREPTESAGLDQQRPNEPEPDF